jgi:hypothetical protein
MDKLQVQTSKGMMKEFSQQMIDDIDLTIEPERQSSFYHYKRWIWMIFPWVCMSVDKRQTFSDLINKCYSSNIGYLSVEEERIFTKYAIEIVIESKLKKKMIYARNPSDSIIAVSGDNSTIGMHKSKSMALNKPGSKGSQITVTDRTHQNSKLTLSKPNPNRTTLAPIAGPKRIQGKKSSVGGSAEFEFFTEVNQPNTSKISGTHPMTKNQTQNQSQATLANGHSKSKVSMILNKSKYWEDRLSQKGFSQEVKTIMIQNQGKPNLSSLSKLRESLGNYTMQELKLLERKNNELINEYNRLIHNWKG